MDLDEKVRLLSRGFSLLNRKVNQDNWLSPDDRKELYDICRKIYVDNSQSTIQDTKKEAIQRLMRAGLVDIDGSPTEPYKRTHKTNIYVASSWRNKYQPEVVAELRKHDFDVYDFRNPEPGDHGFHWHDIDQNWQEWTPEQYISNLGNPIALKGFGKDYNAMLRADACVLVLPCGRSAHLEAGWFIGAVKKTIIYIPEKIEPELMYKMTTHVYDKMEDVIRALKGELI